MGFMFWKRSGPSDVRSRFLTRLGTGSVKSHMRRLNYLRETELQVGLILNFKHPKLQFRRVAFNSAEPALFTFLI